jgi:hypothetical protein
MTGRRSLLGELYIIACLLAGLAPLLSAVSK